MQGVVKGEKAWRWQKVDADKEGDERVGVVSDGKRRLSLRQRAGEARRGEREEREGGRVRSGRKVDAASGKQEIG